MSPWEGVMQKHAKSFYLASLFFPSSLMPRVKALYALCRWLDDAVDEAPDSHQALKNLNHIMDDLNEEDSALPVNQIYKDNQLDPGYIQDLADGARYDLQKVRIQNREELIRYSYQVAGTVGLAMFDLMRVQNPRARAHAVDLGLAMQITNICRDVKEDLERGRIYLPLDSLARQGISEAQFLSGDYSDQQLVAAVRENLALADRYYASAAQAFTQIPWRTRGAILIAAALYRGIGLKLLRKGGDPMRGRTYLTTLEKMAVVSKTLLSWLGSSFQRPRLEHDSSLHRGLETWQQQRNFLL